MKKHKRQPEAIGGFTLVELVMAITILALIVGSITAGLRLASVTIERGEDIAREAARLRAVVGVMERSIRSADPLPVSVGGHTKFFFIGTDKRLMFLTAQSAAVFGAEGSRLVSFHEIYGPGGGLAVSTVSPFRAEGLDMWEGIENPRILAPGAQDLEFSYSPGPDKFGSWEWLPEWDPRERGGLPAAVRVEFTTYKGETPTKTAFVATVMAAGGAGI